jgi:hypothetical protein
MKKYLVILFSLTCINAFAQQPQLDPEKQKRIQEFLAKEIEKMPDPIARGEAEYKDRIARQKALEEHKKHMESPEVKTKIAQMDMFQKMLRYYNSLEGKAKNDYHEDMFKHGFAFYDEMKKKAPNNPGVLTPSGDSSKFILTYTDKLDYNLSDSQINSLSENFSRMVCENPQLLSLLGTDTPIQGVFNINGKVVGKVDINKKDCRYIDFKIK